MRTVAVYESELLVIVHLCQATKAVTSAIAGNPTGVPEQLVNSAARFANMAEHIAQHALPGGLQDEVRLRNLAEDYAELAAVVSEMRTTLGHLSLPSERDLEFVAGQLGAAIVGG